MSYADKKTTMRFSKDYAINNNECRTQTGDHLFKFIEFAIDKQQRMSYADNNVKTS